MLTYFEKHNKISWIITIFIAFIIFYISSLSFPDIPGIPEFSLKPIIYHFFAFFFFNAFLMISVTKGKKKNKHLIILAIIISILYGILDEFHQYFVPSRNPSIRDVLMDSTGILLAAVFYKFRLGE